MLTSCRAYASARKWDSESLQLYGSAGALHVCATAIVVV